MNEQDQHGFKVGDRVEGYDGRGDGSIKPSLIGQTGTVTGFGKLSGIGAFNDLSDGAKALLKLMMGLEPERGYVAVKMDNPTIVPPHGRGVMHFAPYHLRKLEPDQDVPESMLDEKEAWAALSKSMGFDLRQGVPERVE